MSQLKVVYNEGVGIAPSDVYANGASAGVASGSAIRLSLSTNGEKTFYVNQQYDLAAFDFLFFDVNIVAITDDGYQEAYLGVSQGPTWETQRLAVPKARTAVLSSTLDDRGIYGIPLTGLTGFRNPAIKFYTSNNYTLTIDIHRIIFGKL